MSSQYDCAMMEMNLILVPHGEATHLLGWADLYHELAHFVGSRNESTILKPLMDLVEGHFAKAIDEATRLGWSPSAIDDLRLFRSLWLGDWIVEFACDLLATFATRLSFAWSNLRLCARMSTDVFGTVRSHPADAARTLAILEMLALVSDGKGQEFVEDRWGELVSTIGAVEPQSFQTAYPKSLLSELAKQAKESFEALGLKPYTSKEDQMADLLHEAWKHFQSHPESYADWERTKIGELRTKLGRKRSRPIGDGRYVERPWAQLSGNRADAAGVPSFRESFRDSKKDECKGTYGAKCRDALLLKLGFDVRPTHSCEKTKDLLHAWAISGIQLAACCNGLANLRRASKPPREEIETLAIDRLACCPKMIKRGPIRVGVTGVRDRPASAYFGRPVARRSTVILREKNGATEAIAERIGKLQVSLLGDQNVVGLEVAVIDAPRVKGCERACRCVRDGK